MMRRLAAMILIVALAGCASPTADQDDRAEAAIVVTAPDDYSYLNRTDGAARPHLHDYWGGRDQIELFELEFPGDVKMVAPAYGNWHVVSFRPPEGRVVPQGTANVTIEVSYQPAVGDQVGRMTIDIETSDSERATIEAALDGPVRIATTLRDADLPHQSLSAWRFSIWSQDSTYLRANGTFHVRVQAERGLPIPLFPGHPDLWNGSSEIRLFEDSGVLMDTNIPSTDYCSAIVLGNCDWTHRPADGITVPFDTAYIEVRLEAPDPWGTPLTLHYHGADTWEFRKAEPSEVSGPVQVFHIPVEGNGDGPYAVASLWEFLVVGQERAVELGHFTVEATAFREDAIVPVGSGGGGREAALQPAGAGHGSGAGAASSVCLPSGGPPPSDRRDLLVTPASQFSLEIRGPAKDVRLVVELCSGESLGGRVTTPAGCRGGTMSVHVIGLSSGQTVADIRCPVVGPGSHSFVLETGASAFSGMASLYGAVFD